MILEILDIDSWKAFFDLIHDSANVVELRLDQDKASMSLLNNHHVCFYNAEYDKDFFESYHVDGIESVLLSVPEFYSIIKTAHKDDGLTLSTDDMNHLKIVLEHDGNRRVFEMVLDEDFGDSPRPPNVPTSLEFSVPLVDLKQPCVDLDKIVKTDRFRMIVSDDTLCIVNPQDTMIDYTQSIVISSVGSASSTVNLHYIDELQKLKKISDYVTFGIGNDVPLCWNVTSVDEFVKIDGLIAPILNDNEE